MGEQQWIRMIFHFVFFVTVEYGFCGKCGVQKALAKDGLKMKDG